MKRRTEIRITAGKGAGHPVLDYIAGRFTYLCRAGWIEQIDAGHLLLNGEKATATDTLATGDRLVFQSPFLAEPEVNTDYAILHEDDDLLVIDKPGGLPCHPKGRYFNHTLWALVKARFASQNLVLVNRLDRETSGIVLLAKSQAAAASCQRQFIGRRVGKRYLAVIRGRMQELVDVEGFIGKDAGSPLRHKMRFTKAVPGMGDEDKEGYCRTVFRPLCETNGFHLIEAMPRTGRQHQIRATLEALGLYLVGDKIYGGDSAIFLRFVDDRLTEADRRFLVLPRQALHAAELSLIHPRTSEAMTFHAPLPADMAALFPGWREDITKKAVDP